jgi:hypothetical protein
MSERNEAIPIKVGDSIVFARVHAIGGEEEVAWKTYDFDPVMNAIKAMAGELGAIFDKVRPSKASVEFSVELAIESGMVTALFFEGGSKSGLKVTLEWESKPDLNNALGQL